jgi:hypothetical protein
LSGFGDGGARTAAHLRLMLVFVVVATWSIDLFVIFLLLLGLFVLLLIIINGLVEFSQKNFANLAHRIRKFQHLLQKNKFIYLEKNA